MNNNNHYKKTEEFYRTSAIKKDGYYDAVKLWPFKHTVWQMRTRKIIFKMIDRLLKHDSISSVVDIGCGRGDLTIEIAKKYPQIEHVAGCDFVDEVLSLGKRDSALIKNVLFHKGNLLKLPFDDNFSDVTLCINVLHHIQKNDFERALSELSRITNKYMILEIKNINNFLSRYVLPTFCGIATHITSVDEVSGILKKFSMKLRGKHEILLFNSLSPLVVLVYEKN